MVFRGKELPAFHVRRSVPYGPKVLVVDDDVELGGLISLQLRHRGFDVSVVTTADAALALTLERAVQLRALCEEVSQLRRTVDTTSRTSLRYLCVRAELRACVWDARSMAMRL